VSIEELVCGVSLAYGADLGRLCFAGCLYLLWGFFFLGVWVDGVGGRSRAWISGVGSSSSVNASFRWALGFPRVRKGNGFICIVVRSWLRGGRDFAWVRRAFSSLSLFCFCLDRVHVLGTKAF